ncbi:MAG: HAMP domain-containing protein [Desulfobacteraceae bacterium]|nr:MAG: HAMP domain-containing protein [Desulfobacteraceae bacterium]
MRMKLNLRVFLNFVLVIVLFGLLGAVLGAWLINRNILNEAQRRVSLDLESAWSVLDGELGRLHMFVSVLGTGKRVEIAYSNLLAPDSRIRLEEARRMFGFDFLSLTDSKGKVIMRTLEPYTTGDYLANDPFVGEALKGKAVKGFSILSPSRLKAEGGNLLEQAFMVFESTPMAKPRAKTFEDSGMALVAAAPVTNEKGTVVGAIYAGVLLNRNHALVDKIRSIVFEDKMYEGRHLGTMTIFQWDTRIATNVTLPNGNKAIGTRVSTDVYDKVLENNSKWYDRAFVVRDWYLSAYDPIHDTEGRVIGILYVGVLAEKYDDLKWELWRLYGLLSVVAGIIVLAVGLIFSQRLSGSMTRLADAAGKIAAGNLSLNVEEPSSNDEIRDLTKAFNIMTGSLRDRDERLRAANAELEHMNASLQKLNKNYMDMLGFVSHELKNTLGVIYTSARALNLGLVGTLTEQQAALVGGIANSIDTAVKMTRNYLDLARIEKGELMVQTQLLDLLEQVVEPVLKDLHQFIASRNMRIENHLPGRLKVSGDRELLRIVYKNFIDNAVKYGREGGTIRLGFARSGDNYSFEVWNDGDGLAPDKLAQLFNKFVRLHRDKETTRSTGLGLFITKDIIEKHGGSVHAESREGEWISFTFTLPVPLPEAT